MIVGQRFVCYYYRYCYDVYLFVLFNDFLKNNIKNKTILKKNFQNYIYSYMHKV